MKALVFLFCGLAWLGCRSALAEDITLPDPLKVANDVYTGSLYVKHDAAYMTFTHESGTARVLISSLPADVRKLLDYDPHAAETQLERARGRRDELTPAPEIPVVTIHGKLIANTEKGLFIAVIRDTGRTRNVQQWSGGAATKSEDSDSGSTSVSSDNTRIASTEEPIYETVYYLVTGNRNAEYLKPGIAVDYVITPYGTDGYEGREATTATFVRSLR